MSFTPPTALAPPLAFSPCSSIHPIGTRPQCGATVRHDGSACAALSSAQRVPPPIGDQITEARLRHGAAEVVCATPRSFQPGSGLAPTVKSPSPCSTPKPLPAKEETVEFFSHANWGYADLFLDFRQYHVCVCVFSRPIEIVTYSLKKRRPSKIGC